jgi:division protein 1
MTMDILWAISHPSSAVPAGHLAGFPVAGAFAMPTPPYADGSWELYQDFIGAVQSWEYALVSGSGDGAVRMWDMRTGQAHRTLLGHTGPVTCLQFDEIHVVSGSLDKSVRVCGWPYSVFFFFSIKPSARQTPAFLINSLFFLKTKLKQQRHHQIWDLRTGGIFETVKYDHGVTALQFDSRKVISAAGENGIKVRGMMYAIDSTVERLTFF